MNAANQAFLAIENPRPGSLSQKADVLPDNEMTNREAIQRQIDKCRRIMIPAMITSLAGFVATTIANATIGGAIGALTAIITFLAFIVWVSAIIGIWHTVRCPSCQKRLGYLLLDPNYSKTFAPVGMPKDIPSEITECPYCHADFGK